MTENEEEYFYTILKIITGECIVGLSNSGITDEKVEIIDPFVLIEYTREDAHLSELKPFMQYALDEVFTFDRKHVIIHKMASEMLAESYDMARKARDEFYENSQTMITSTLH